MGPTLTEYWNDERGLTTIEYTLLLTFVFMISMSAWRPLVRTGTVDQVRQAFQNLGR